MAVKLSPQRKVLAVAASQIGYSRWNDPKRGTKYARETQPVFWPRDYWLLANGISYCDLFVTWVFWKALGKSFVTSGALPAGASYNTDYRASKGGRISKSSARPGDVLVFDWNWNTYATNHVGILEKRLSGSRFQTIEGNTSSGSSGSQSNGGRVARRVRRHNQVRYVIRPDWSKAGGSSGLEPWEKSKAGGSSGLEPWEKSKRISTMPRGTVKGVQRLLAGLGYDLGSYGVDGSYKADTYNAVRAAQKALGVTVDGIAGPDTMNALTGAQKPTQKPSRKVEVDGRYGTKTHSEVQRRRGLPIDGRLGAGDLADLCEFFGLPKYDEISDQPRRHDEIGNAIVPGIWDHDPDHKGPNSVFVRTWEAYAGANVDRGSWGPELSRRIQIMLNEHDAFMRDRDAVQVQRRAKRAGVR